jgi:hypothetical protein
MVRKYEEKDFETICRWLQAHGKSVPERDLLPDTGCIVDGVACGFIYLTNSSLGIIEWYVTNPEVSEIKRGHALQAITAHLIHAARALGYKYLMANTEIEGVAKLAGRNGFTYTGLHLSFFRGI